MNYVIQVRTPADALPVCCNCQWLLNRTDRDNGQCSQPGEGLVAKSLNNFVEANITPPRGGADPNGSFFNSVGVATGESVTPDIFRAGLIGITRSQTG